MFGELVKAAIATAGGEGSAIEKPLSAAVSDFVTAEERVRQLEADRVTLSVRKARLEAQRDERDNFVMPLLVGLNATTLISNGFIPPRATRFRGFHKAITTNSNP